MTFCSAILQPLIEKDESLLPELQGICHKMHAALKTHSVSDQSTRKANVEYKFIQDRSETDLPFVLGQELEIEWTEIFLYISVQKTPKSYSQGHCFKCFKQKLNVTCVLWNLKPVIIIRYMPKWFCTQCLLPTTYCLFSEPSALKIGITVSWYANSLVRLLCSNKLSLSWKWVHAVYQDI